MNCLSTDQLLLGHILGVRLLVEDHLNKLVRIELAVLVVIEGSASNLLRGTTTTTSTRGGALATALPGGRAEDAALRRQMPRVRICQVTPVGKVRGGKSRWKGRAPTAGS